MISLDMLPLNRAEPGADSAVLISTVRIWAIIFGDIFGDLFGGGRSSRRANNGPMKGANLRASVNITFEEAVFGCEKQLELNLKDECTTCHGSGAKPGTSPETCPEMRWKGPGGIYPAVAVRHGAERPDLSDCNGTGKVIKEKCPNCRGTGYTSSRKRRSRFRFRRASTTARASASGKRESRESTEAPEAIFWWRFVWARHPIFQRQDMNIFSTAPITFAQAALGGEVRISTVDGDVLYEVKPGTQTDTKVRLKGKGVPSLRTRR